ncbi:MAG: DUF1963 domain-containing protein [Deltaproteobacteria bacterium]|nr:DUF1963 domain-containing protein [Deltaproteobacteria bacterium]
MSEQINLWKKGPSKAIPRLEWNTWITGTTLEWFDHKQRTARYVQVGDNKNGRREYPSEEAALAAQQRAIAKKLAEGYEYEDEPPPPPPAKPSKVWAKQPAKARWASKVAKELAAIRKLIKSAKLEHRSADIESLVRPAIKLKPKTVKSVKGIVTRFGGDPDVPAKFSWPKGLAFVAQYRLDELAKFDLEGLLPKRGLLSVFANLVPFEGYGEQAKVFYYPDLKGLAPMASPDPEDGRGTAIATAAPSVRLTLPPPDSSAVGSLKLGDEERERYHDEVWLATFGEESDAHQLLGWPLQMNEHAYTKGQQLLVQLASDDRIGLEIGDVETMYFHISEKKLKAAKFDDVRSAIGGD